MGNKDNYMNSVAVVERPDKRIYMVALMTNVLKKIQPWITRPWPHGLTPLSALIESHGPLGV